MTTKSQEALDIALQLDRSERAAIAARLIASLDDEVDDGEDWDSSWGQELERREQAILEGKARWVPQEEALQRIFQRPASA